MAAALRDESAQLDEPRGFSNLVTELARRGLRHTSPTSAAELIFRSRHPPFEAEWRFLPQSAESDYFRWSPEIDEDLKETTQKLPFLRTPHPTPASIARNLFFFVRLSRPQSPHVLELKLAYNGELVQLRLLGANSEELRAWAGDVGRIARLIPALRRALDALAEPSVRDLVLRASFEYEKELYPHWLGGVETALTALARLSPNAKG